MSKWNIGWGVVSSCNMSCEFCYSRMKRSKVSDIDPKYWTRFIDKNAEFISSINYGTGENTLSKDWFYLIKYIREKYPHIRQALTTNGYISEAIRKNAKFKKIFLSAIDEVDVSLDYAEKEKHNKFRGQLKAYDWAMDAIEFCHLNKIPLTIVMLGSKINLYEDNVRQIFEIAKRFDAIVRINIYRPTQGVNDFSKKFILSTDELLSFLHFVNSNYKVLSLNDTLLSSLLIKKISEDPSGTTSLRILPNGDVTPSTYLISDEFIIGNLKDNVSLKDIDKNEKLNQKIQEIIPVACKNCEHKLSCKGGVIDRRYLWHGTLEEKDPYCFIEDMAMLKKYNFLITTSDEEFHSVHDGYLPTMFFKNK